MKQTVAVGVIKQVEKKEIQKKTAKISGQKQKVWITFPSVDLNTLLNKSK